MGQWTRSDFTVKRNTESRVIQNIRLTIFTDMFTACNLGGRTTTWEVSSHCSYSLAWCSCVHYVASFHIQHHGVFPGTVEPFGTANNERGTLEHVWHMMSLKPRTHAYAEHFIYNMIQIQFLHRLNTCLQRLIM